MEEESANNEEGSGGDEVNVNLRISKQKCVFCAVDCPATFSVVDGQVIGVKEEGENTSGGGGGLEECATVERQLRSLFIVRKILNVSEEVMGKFLEEFGGQLNPEYWVNVCPSCRTDVYQLFKIEKLIKTLEVQAKEVKNNLKKLICRSGVGGSGEEGDSVPERIWKEIREKAIEGFTYEEDPEEPSFEDLVRSHNHHDLEEEEEGQEGTSGVIQSEPGAEDEEPAQADPPPVSSIIGKKIYYQCEVCNALIPKSNAGNFQHETLHVSGDGKKCPEVNCGWLVRSLGNHRNNWHNGNAPDASADNVLILPLAEYEKNHKRRRTHSESSSESSEDEEPVEPKPQPIQQQRSSSPVNGRTVYYQCELCNALVSRKVININRHRKLHRSGDGRGNSGKKCPETNCGWLVANLGRHHHIWHSGSNTPDNFVIRPLSQFGMKREEKQNKKWKASEINVSFQTPAIPLTPSNSQECKECGSLFKTKRRLETHLSECHGGGSSSEEIPSTSTSTPYRKRYDPASVLKVEYSSPLSASTSQSSSVTKMGKRLFPEKIEKSSPQPQGKSIPIERSATQNSVRASTSDLRSLTCTHRTLSSSAPAPPAKNIVAKTPNRLDQTLQDTPTKLRVYFRKCSDCGSLHKSRNLLEVHKQLHESGQGVSCPDCGWWVKARSLKMHQNNYHSANRKSFLTEGNKSRSEMCFPENTPFYCDHCTLIYADVGSFINHFVQSHKKEVGLIDCAFCEEKMESQQLLQFHVNWSHPEEANQEDDDEVQMTCSQCLLIFPSKLKCDFHIATEHPESILSCAECGISTFPSFWMYKKHNSTFHDGRSAKPMCDICNVLCQNNFHLLHHRRLAHAEELGNRNKVLSTKEGYQDNLNSGHKLRGKEGTSQKKAKLGKSPKQEKKRAKRADDGPSSRTRRNGKGMENHDVSED